MIRFPRGSEEQPESEVVRTRCVGSKPKRTETPEDRTTAWGEERTLPVVHSSQWHSFRQLVRILACGRPVSGLTGGLTSGASKDDIGHECALRRYPLAFCDRVQKS